MTNEQKVVLVTGSTGDLGREVVSELLSEGYQVIGTVRPGKLDSSKKRDRLSYIEVDLTSEHSCRQSAQQILQSHPKLHAVILLAGGFAMGNLENTSEEALDQMITLNFKSAFNMVRPVFGSMTTGGRVVLISGRPALDSSSGKDTLAYSLSKSMLHQFAMLLNAEREDNGVVTSIVVPGIMDTESNRKSMPKANRHDWVNLGKVAETIAFLCSEKASELRGPVLKLYGNS